MIAFNFEGRKFRTISNAETGDVGAETLFQYHQQGDLVWATYEGGGVRFGQLIATIDARGELDMRYQHVSASGELKTGVCRSVPEVLSDGRYRVHERWRWTCGDGSTGESQIEEIRK